MDDKMSNNYPVLIVGLDGATFDLMLPWIDEGRLPNLGRLLQEGAHSRLESTIPPITPCAWSSFMTGKNPGKHGLFDFVEPDAEGRGFRFTNASFRDGETLWGCLSRHGRRVGVVNVPMTYPPEPVNGYLISGLDTPHELSPFMYPVEVRHELKQAGIRYRIDQQHLGNMRTDARREKQLKDIFDAETWRTDAFQKLSQVRPSDFRMIVYGATDQVQHHFWHFMDSSHDKHDAEGAKKFQHAIRDTYEHIDKQLGRILQDTSDDTAVIIMSDHGFGPTSSIRLRLNGALHEAGLLEFEQTETRRPSVTRKLAGWLDGMLRSTLSSDAKRTIAGMFPKLRVWFENLDEAKIDWSNTKAHCNEAYRSSPAVWIKKIEAIANGHTTSLCESVEQALKSLVDPQTGEPVISSLHRPRESYTGPHTERAPELLPSWWEDGFLIEQSEPAGDAPLVERSTSPVEGGVEFAGSHRLDGVFMASGGPFRQGVEFTGARITDVTPTVLHVMGFPIPNDMDGHVLSDALEDDFLASRNTEWEEVDDDQTLQDEERSTFTHNESELIAKRLQALGYIN